MVTESSQDCYFVFTKSFPVCGIIPVVRKQQKRKTVADPFFFITTLLLNKYPPVWWPEGFVIRKCRTYRGWTFQGKRKDRRQTPVLEGELCCLRKDVVCLSDCYRIRSPGGICDRLVETLWRFCERCLGREFPGETETLSQIFHELLIRVSWTCLRSAVSCPRQEKQTCFSPQIISPIFRQPSIPPDGWSFYY